MAAMRKMKNVVNNYTVAEVKVREATSNDPWGPSSSLMSEIADMTYNVMAFSQIMSMIWKRIDDHGKNWRHVYKSLVLLEYIIKTGTEKVAAQCRENIYAIQTLKDFKFIDKDGKDQGMNVREKSKTMVALLKDEERLKTERVRALKAKERFAQASQGVGSETKANPDTAFEAKETTNNTTTNNTDISRPAPTSEMEQARPQTAGEEELQLQLALAMSKEEADLQEEQKKHDDLRLRMAINESEQEQQMYQSPYKPALIDSTPPVQNDPWSSGTPTSIAPPPQANDPWGPPPASSNTLAALSDPWGTHTQPPQSAPAPAAASSPWSSPVSQPPAVPPASDPWAPIPATGVQSDPWGASPIHKGPPPDPDSEFDFLRKEEPVMASTNMFVSSSAPPPMQQTPFPQPATNGNAFNLDPLAESLPPMQKPKKAEDFLGENSSLVNLDSLIEPPRQSAPAMTANNPFLMSGSVMADSSPAVNPFHQPKQPAPSINQMRQQPFMSSAAGPAPGFQSFPPAGGPGLPPPLIPSSGMSQPQQNPFL